MEQGKTKTYPGLNRGTKVYGLMERLKGSAVLFGFAVVYLFTPRETEICLLGVMEMRKAARKVFHGDTE